MSTQIYHETPTGILVMSEVKELLKEWKYLIEEKRNDAFSSFELIDVNERISEALLDTLKEVESDLD
jgi:hypothetical protein